MGFISIRQKTIQIFLLFIIVYSYSSSILAWDADPESCMHDVCSGGATPVWTGVLDTQPKYLKSRLPTDKGRAFHNTSSGTLAGFYGLVQV